MRGHTDSGCADEEFKYLRSLPPSTLLKNPSSSSAGPFNSLGPTRSRTGTLFSPLLSLWLHRHWLMRLWRNISRIGGSGWPTIGADQTVGSRYLWRCKKCNVETCCLHVKSIVVPSPQSPRGRAANTHLAANPVPAFAMRRPQETTRRFAINRLCCLRHNLGSCRKSEAYRARLRAVQQRTPSRYRPDTHPPRLLVTHMT